MPFMGIEHWTIAICDDDEIFLSRLEKQIRAELQQLNVVGQFGVLHYLFGRRVLTSSILIPDPHPATFQSAGSPAVPSCRRWRSLRCCGRYPGNVHVA